MPTTQALIDLVAHNQNSLGLGLLLLSACIEYLFPPFPGDLITVFGAFLVARRGWSGPAVFAAVTLGSALGCMIDYAVGRWLGGQESRWATGRLARFRPKIDLIVERFCRHGALYLVLNRFIPSLRALFFVAAGMARLPAWRVLLFGTLSAILWNGLLLLLGFTVGESWDRLRALFEAYGIAFWALLVTAGLGWLGYRRLAATRRP